MVAACLYPQPWQERRPPIPAHGGASGHFFRAPRQPSSSLPLGPAAQQEGTRAVLPRKWLLCTPSFFFPSSLLGTDSSLGAEGRQRPSGTRVPVFPFRRAHSPSLPPSVSPLLSASYLAASCFSVAPSTSYPALSSPPLPFLCPLPCLVHPYLNAFVHPAHSEVPVLPQMGRGTNKTVCARESSWPLLQPIPSAQNSARHTVSTQ